MAQVTVTPEEWHYVAFDSGRIATVADKLLGEIGLDVDLAIEVDETTPMGRVSTTSLEPLTVSVESGAFEDAKRPRQLSEQAVADVLGGCCTAAVTASTPASASRPRRGAHAPAVHGVGCVRVGRCARSATRCSASAGSTTSATVTASATSPTAPSPASGTARA